MRSRSSCPTLCLLSALLIAQPAWAGTDTMPSSPLGRLEASANALAKSKSVEDTRALTDAVFDFLGVELCAGNPIRERVVAAELRFRQRNEGAVSETTLAEAINHLVDTYHGQSWLRTNAAQIHIFRSQLKTVVPSLIGGSSHKRFAGVRTSMGPAEATLVAFYLSLGKMYSEEYQVDPDAWVQKAKADDKAAHAGEGDSVHQTSRGGRATFSIQPLSKFAEQADRIRAAVSEESSLSIVAANTFLDRLGLIKR